MSREKKYRAWDKYNNRWWTYAENFAWCSPDNNWQVEFYSDEKNNFKCRLFNEDGAPETGELYKTKELQMVESTNLKDKNGVEIYEGDVLHIVEKGNYGGEYNAEIVYLENWALFGIILVNIKVIAKSKTNTRVDTIFTHGFLSRKFGSCISLGEIINFEHYEVIGNVFENPELLENPK